VEGTLIITEDGANLVMTPSFRTTDGPVRAGRLVVPKAGGIVRAPEGEVAYDSSIVTRVNPNTIQVVTTLQGKEGVRVQLTLSPDGKTLSRSREGYSSLALRSRSGTASRSGHPLVPRSRNQSKACGLITLQKIPLRSLSTHHRRDGPLFGPVRAARQGQFQGQSWGQRGSRNSKPRVYLGFSSR